MPAWSSTRACPVAPSRSTSSRCCRRRSCASSARRRSPSRSPGSRRASGTSSTAPPRAPTRPAPRRSSISSHGGDEEGEIRAALDAGVGFIGVVCSRTRGRALLDGLGLTDEEAARVHTHVGVDIGARTAPEVALSILAAVVRSIRLDGVAPVDPVEAAPPAVATDPVCGMSVTIGPDAIHATVNGVDHWFCCPGCRKHFLAELRLVTGAVATAVVLAAGGSRRLGRPKQLLDYRGATLLDATLGTARGAEVDAGGRRARRRRRRGARAGRPRRRRRGAQPGLRRRLQHLHPVGARFRARRRRRGGADARRPARRASRNRARRWCPLRRTTPSACASTTTGSATRCGSTGGCSTSSPACTVTRRSGSWSTPATTSSGCGSPATSRATWTPGRTTRPCSRRPP